MSGIERHDDIQGVLTTAVSGVTQYTFKQYRTTGVVYPHIAQTDIFCMTFQMPHRKKLNSNLDGIHIHYIPIASANGTIRLDYEWGYFNHCDTIPDNLPNTGTKVITLATTDQYQLKVDDLVTDLTAPSEENYSSILMIKVTRSTPTGTNWGASNEIALVYMDAHYITERTGSILEYSDV